jgi:uncharacterized protein (TIGR02246 family)
VAAFDPSLASRLQRLEDVEEIRQLLQRYADCLDAADFAGYASLFAEDGELVAKLGRARGQKAIRELLDGAIGPTLATRRTAFHLVGNPTISVDGDRAESRVLWAYLTHDDTGAPIILQLGHYHDRLVREAGRWRFARREISRDLGVSPLEQGDTDDR